MMSTRVCKRTFLRLASGGMAALALPLAAAKAATPFTTFAFPATGRSNSATDPDRWSDVYNVKRDFGAAGDGSTIDTAAINNAFTAFWGSTNKGGIMYFPPGIYIVDQDIIIGNNSTQQTNGRIIGGGRLSTAIQGTLNNGFIFRQNDGTGGPSEIAHMSFINASTYIGSGAMMLNDLNGASIHDCSFSGMVGLLLPSNIFDVTIDNCTGAPNSDATTGHSATFGIAGACPHIRGWRSTSNWDVCFQLFGGNSSVISGNGIEDCSIAVLLGMQTGWASSCTISGTTLTVGGNLGSSSATKQFQVGCQIFMRGLGTQTWGSDPNDSSAVTIIGLGTGTGFAGTYTISTSAAISTPVPCLSRIDTPLTGVALLGLQTEACYHSIYVNDVGGCVIEGGGGGATGNECVDKFGTTGYTARAGLYVRKAASTKITGYSAAQATYLGSIVIDPTQQSSNLTFDSCGGTKKPDAVTGSGTIISNGSGGAGTILNVDSSSVSGSFIGIGMAVTGTGVSANTTITGNNASDNTLTGTGGAGTYRVNNSQNVSATSMTITSGADWVMPTGASAKTGVIFINCGGGNLPNGYSSGLNSLNRTFASLPGQGSANANVDLVEGQEFDIVDAATGNCSDSACNWGANVTGGGGSLNRKVRYNGTNWTVVGK